MHATDLTADFPPSITPSYKPTHQNDLQARLLGPADDAGDGVLRVVQVLVRHQVRGRVQPRFFCEVPAIGGRWVV